MKETDTLEAWVKARHGIDLEDATKENAPIGVFMHASLVMMREVPRYIEAVLAERLPK